MLKAEPITDMVGPIPMHRTISSEGPNETLASDTDPVPEASMPGAERKRALDVILAAGDAIINAGSPSQVHEVMSRYSIACQSEEAVLAEAIEKINQQIAIGSKSNSLLTMLNDSTVLAFQSIAINTSVGDFAESYIDAISLPAMRSDATQNRITPDPISSGALDNEMRDFITGHQVQSKTFQSWFGLFTRPVSLALKLIEAIEDGNDEEAERIAALPDCGVSTFRAMLNLARVPESEIERIRIKCDEFEEKAKLLSDSNETLNRAVTKINEANIRRTNVARQSKADNSNIPEIDDWFARQEKQGRSLMDRSLTKEGEKLFNLSRDYIAKRRRIYLEAKSAAPIR